MKKIFNFPRKSKKVKNSAERDAAIILAHGVFDSEYYLNKYPDVSKEGFNPVKHYCEHGWKEGRNPSESFNTVYYKNSNPDVFSSGMNPLVHWILHGNREGRPISSHAQSMSLPKNTSEISKIIEISIRDEKQNQRIIADSGQFDEEYYLKNEKHIVNNWIINFYMYHQPYNVAIDR